MDVIFDLITWMIPGFCSSSTDGFRRSLLKWVKEEFSPADYHKFQEEADLLRKTYLILKAATLRVSHFRVGRTDQ